MSTSQKIIKYVAISFAIFLIFSILTGIVSVLKSLDFFFNDTKSLEEKLDGLVINNDSKILNIDVAAAEVIIQSGDELKAEANDQSITITKEENQLHIVEKNRNWFQKKKGTKVTVYVPKEWEFDGVAIDTGAGKVEIQEIRAKLLYLEIGAGEMVVNNLQVSEKMTLEGGAGNIEIKQGILRNLDLDMGVGRVKITSKILGESDIDAGVGDIDLVLSGTKEDYYLDIDKGIGKITINGNDVKDGTNYGNGINKLEIDGGVGNIKIKLQEEVIQEEIVSFIRTYTLLMITQANEDNSYYLTIQPFQGEVDTVLVTDLTQKLEINKNYEFTLQRVSSKDEIENTVDSIFKHTVILNIEQTDKQGLEQRNETIK